MYSMIGLSIGAVIGLIIAILKYSKEQQALQGRRGHKLDRGFGEDSQFHEDFVLRFEDFKILEKYPNHPLKTTAEARAEMKSLEGLDLEIEELDTPLDALDKTEVVKVYASRDAQKMNALCFAILFGLGLWIIYMFNEFGALGNMRFPFRVGGGLLSLFGPFIGVLIFYKLPQKKPHDQRKPILEFTHEGMTCHSYKCGSVRTIHWSDIVSFTPKLPNWGLAVSVDIDHKLSENSETRISNYSINVIDLELVEFIELLENYTGLAAERV